MKTKKTTLQRILRSPFFIILWLSRGVYFLHIPLFLVNYGLRWVYYATRSQWFLNILLNRNIEKDNHNESDDEAEIVRSLKLYSQKKFHEALQIPFMLDMEHSESPDKMREDEDDLHSSKSADEWQREVDRELAFGVFSLPFEGLLMCLMHIVLFPLYLLRVLVFVPMFLLAHFLQFVGRKGYALFLRFTSFLGRQFNAVMENKSDQKE